MDLGGQSQESEEPRRTHYVGPSRTGMAGSFPTEPVAGPLVPQEISGRCPAALPEQVTPTSLSEDPSDEQFDDALRRPPAGLSSAAGLIDALRGKADKVVERDYLEVKSVQNWDAETLASSCARRLFFHAPSDRVASHRLAFPRRSRQGTLRSTRMGKLQSQATAWKAVVEILTAYVGESQDEAPREPSTQLPLQYAPNPVPPDWQDLVTLAGTMVALLEVAVVTQPALATAARDELVSVADTLASLTAAIEGST